MLPHLALIGSSLRGCWSSAVPADEGSCPGPSLLPTPDQSLPRALPYICILLLHQVARSGGPHAEVGISLCRVRALKVRSPWAILSPSSPRKAVRSVPTLRTKSPHHLPFPSEYHVEVFIASTPSGVRCGGAPVCQSWSCVCTHHSNMFCKDEGSGVEAASVKFEAGKVVSLLNLAVTEWSGPQLPSWVPASHRAVTQVSGT